jgi:hypothetical protein
MVRPLGPELADQEFIADTFGLALEQRGDQQRARGPITHALPASGTDVLAADRQAAIRLRCGAGAALAGGADLQALAAAPAAARVAAGAAGLSRCRRWLLDQVRRHLLAALDRPGARGVELCGKVEGLHPEDQRLRSARQSGSLRARCRAPRRSGRGSCRDCRGGFW